MVSDVPLGAFLSGGVDSSSVVASMARCSSGRVVTFSMGFVEGHYDERHFCELLSKRLALEHHAMILRPELMDILPKLVTHFGEPCAIGSAIPLYYLAQLASRHVKVVLSGDSADEIFGGYVNYYRMRMTERIRKIRFIIPSEPLLAHLIELLPLSAGSPVGSLVRRVRRLRQSINRPRCARLGLLDKFSGVELLALSKPENEIPEYVQAFKRAEKGTDWLWPYLYADIKVLLESEMFTKLDRMTMAHGIEGRVPFADYRLVELAAKIPAQFKVRRGSGKIILKAAMSDRLPGEVLTRRKAGFRLPLNEWFRGPLKTMAMDLLTDREFRHSGIFDNKSVAWVLDHHLRGREDYGGLLLELVIFEIWRRDIHKVRTPFRFDRTAMVP